MIGRLYRALPGPTPVKVIESIVIIVVLLLLLNIFYNWLGSSYLDPGGTIE